MEGIDWSPIFSREDDDLVRPFTVEEIKKVVFSCDINKFLGVDGFPVASIKTIGVWLKVI